ncbi:MAG: hypothetical protein IJO06_02025 [Thermoguttaceae bacterium]|nr:hypothetical protein [Thermoguttaceae bacterium]
MTTKSKPRENRSCRFAFLSRLKSRRVRAFVAASPFAAFAALAFGLGFDVRSDAAPPLRPPRVVRPVEPTEPGGQVAPNATKISNLPFAGIATKTSEEKAQELAGKSPSELLDAAKKLTSEGMSADAVVLCEAVVDSAEATEHETLSALSTLNDAVGPIASEAFYERATQTRPNSWRLKQAFANALAWNDRVIGKLVDGVFVRSERWDADALDGTALYRVRALRLLNEALPLVRAEQATLFPNGLDAPIDEKAAQTLNETLGLPTNSVSLVADAGRTDAEARFRSTFYNFYNNFAKMFRNAQTFNGERDERWRLQAKTDLDVLPDCEPVSHRYNASRRQGAPVDADGNPVFFATPETFEAAQNDGERALYMESQAFAVGNPAERFHLLQARGTRAQATFGVQTLSDYSRYFPTDPNAPNAPTSETGIWELHTLDDSETIAKLATGVKRFKLPDDENCLVLWREALEHADTPQLGVGAKEHLLSLIAKEYENRRQFDKAADVWRELLDACADNRGSYPNVAREALDQILNPWGRFDLVASKINGAETVVSYVARNADAVEFVVREIDAEKLLAEFRKVANSNPNAKNDLFSPQIEFFLQRQGVEKIAEKYLGPEVARRTVEIEPEPGHFNRRYDVALPISRGGLFYVEATAKNSEKTAEKTSAFFWKPDAAIVSRSTADGEYFYVADAVTGAPLANVEAELFVVETSWNRDGNRRTRAARSEKVKTDENGSFVVEKIPGFGGLSSLLKSSSNRYYTVFTFVPSVNPNEPARFAYLATHRLDAQLRRAQNFTNDEANEQARAYFVSDRPLYRPGQKAEFKFWLGTAKYDLPETHLWAGKEVKYSITSPRGDEVKTQTVVLDDFGAFAGSFELPKDAQLGVYNVQIRATNDRYWYGGGSFRLEEYRKPEFEVAVDAPAEPITLGDKIKATISAKYLFGAPVAEGEVSYKVTRTRHNETWYPVLPWDWFYGPGYGWLHCDAVWYPGWSNWGWRRPVPTWFPRSGGVPEVVLDGTAKLDADGKAQIVIDTSFAKELFPNDDQRYEITAEVVDRSRRTIVGTGSVFATRDPFKVCVWTNRGFYDAASQIDASFQTRRVDGKPVVGEATVRLFKIEYRPTNADSQTASTNALTALQPVETEVFSKRVATNADGFGALSLSAAEPGQYRLSCEVETPQGLRREGGVLLTVGATSRNAEKQADAKKASGESAFRFGDLELTLEKSEFKVGETARLQIASDRPDASVLLFERPEHGLAPTKPRVVKLENGTAYVDVKIEKRDMPNFFVEAGTVSNGEFYSVSREIVVPPENRVLNVEVQPSKATVAPGEKTKIAVRLTDLEGRPIVGQTVVTVYDKALEQLAGRGPNDEDVRKFFWNWRRYGQSPDFATNLREIFRIPQGAEPKMRDLGIFGGSIFTNSSALSLNGDAEDFAVVEEAAMEMDAAPMAMSARSMAAAPAPAMATGAMEGGMGGGAVFKSSATNAIRRRETGDSAVAMGGSSSQTSAQPEFVEATTRKNLADLAFWAADLLPNDDGVIEIEVETPENLTTWKVAAWSVGAGLRVGSGTSEFVSRKDVIVRMQKPRFLTQNDEAVLSAIVHNYLDSEKTVQVSLEFDAENADSPRLTLVDNADGSALNAPGIGTNAATRTVVVPAGGEARVDWLVKAQSVGESTLTMKALTDEESDAIQETLPILERGMAKQIAVSGMIPAADAASSGAKAPREAKFRLTVPEARRPETTKLTVRFSPTLAGAIFDALPYMIEYPYGCNEQTLNRFLPLVIAQKALIDSGVDLASLKEKRANLNAQELGDAKERAAQWSRNASHKAVYDVNEARKLAQIGVDKLVAAQCNDGGWGWFSGVGERSTAEMTALVVRGLILARANDQAVPEHALQNGIAWLQNHQREESLKILRGKVWSDERKAESDAWRLYKNGADEADALVYYTLSEAGIRPVPFSETFVDTQDTENVSITDNPAELFATMKEFLWEARTELQLYPLSMFALALDDETKTATQGQTPELAESRTVAKSRVETILRRLSQYRKVDNENQTVWLALNGVPGWYFWRWHGSEMETQAAYLKLLSRVDAETLRRLGIADDAPRLVKYLLNNRKHATYWNSTRDSAVCVEAFVEYLRRTDELATDSKVEVYVDGELRKTVEYSPETLFETDGTLVLDAAQIASGDREIVLKMTGANPLYYNAYLEFFTLEDPIEKAGLEVKVERRYYKLVPRKDATSLVEGGRGQAVSQRVERFEKVALNNGDSVTSGDLIEVELTLESKNEYESILLEDRKAAGYEPVETTSGYNGNNLGAYVEYRDDRVCFFASRIPQGRTTVSYRLRAETPGRFSALPTRVEAMYAPELKGNSDEFKANVLDREIGGDAK